MSSTSLEYQDEDLQPFCLINPIVATLRNILATYPEGSEFRELLQNADDAGATDVRFIIDWRSFGTKSLLLPQFAAAQGPALVLQNNGLFTEKDWENIRHVGESMKKEDLAATGQFGFGFRSVFHITDYPFIITNDRFGVIDPLNKLSKTGGVQCIFGKIRSLDDQSAPYRSLLEFGCDFSRPYTPGESVPDKNTMKDYLAQFRAEAPLFLLFLKRVERVQFLEFESDGTVREIFAVHIPDLGEEMRKQRTLIDSYTRSHPKDDRSWLSRIPHEMRTEYTMSIATRYRSGDAESVVTETKWLVLGMLASGEMAQLALKGTEHHLKLKLVPLGAVAIPLNGLPLTNAHAFCFLETSIETFLPIPVHAWFRLMQQRRALEDAGFPKWNPSLCTLILAPLYIDALLRIAAGKYGSQMSLEQFYSLWPEAKTVAHPWSDLVDAFYQQILPSHALIGSPSGFIALKDALFPSPDCPPVVWNEFVERKAPVALVPDRIVTQLSLRHKDALRVSPGRLRLLLRTTAANVPTTEKVIPLLEYAFSKLPPLAQRDKCQSAFDDFSGVPLLPLENGSVATFSKDPAAVASPFFLVSEEEKALFGSVSHRFVSSSISPQLRKYLEAAQAYGLNVVTLGAKHLRQLIATCYPALASAEAALAAPSSSLPSQEWLEALWRYIDGHWRKEAPQALEGLRILPVLVTGEEALERIGSPRVLSQPEVPQQFVVSVLQQLGCALLRPDCALPIAYLHEARLVQRFSLLGVLQALASLPQIRERSQKLPSSGADALRNYAIAKFGDITDAPNRVALIETLKSLSIFPLRAPPVLLSLTAEPHPVIPPADLEDVVLLSLRPFISVQSDEERVFYSKRLAVKQIEAKDFVRNVLFLALKKSILDTASALSILKYTLLHSTTEDLLALKSAAIFPNRSGRLCRIESLLNPNVTDLEQLLTSQQAEEMLLHRSLCDSVRVSQLTRIGLRSTLSATEISSLISSAVSSLETIGVEVGIAYLSRLLSYISSHANEIDLKALPRDLPWIPVLHAPPQDLQWLPWAAARLAVPLSPPSAVRPPKDIPLCSAVRDVSVAQQHEVSPRVQAELFEWNSPVNTELILQQIEELAKISHPPKGMWDVMSSIYAALDEAMQRTEERTLSLLRGRNWIWTSTAFLGADRVAFDNPVARTESLLPVIPKQFSDRYHSLFKKAGVHATYPPEAFLAMLETVPQRQPLDDSIADVILEMLRYIVRCKAKTAVALSIQNALVPVTELLFLDNARLDVPADLSARLLSPRLSSVEASVLGIKTLSEHLGIESRIEGEPWGQKLPLCKALRNITRQYPRDSILKEFLQNADDAGASYIHFVYDQREHPTESIVGSRLAPLQGPSLVIFNNRSFSSADIEHIREVASEPKLQDVTKTGLFGLGFNSCYCITDVPSLVTNGMMYFFDPHAGTDKQFLQSASLADPGRKYKLLDQNLAWIKDHVTAHSFPEFGCKIDQKFEGVLFRFPFRSAKAATESEIHSEPFTHDDMMAMMNELTEEAHSMPLFLHHVREVCFSIWPKDAPKMQQILKVTRTDQYLPLDPSNPTEAFSLLSALEAYKVDPKKAVAFRTARHTRVAMQQLNKQSVHDWLVDEALQTNATALIEKMKTHHLRAVPFCGVAIPISPLEPVSGRLFYTLPLRLSAPTHLPVHMNAGWQVCADRRDIERPKQGEVATWHQYLMEELLAPSYSRAIVLLTLLTSWWQSSELSTLLDFFFSLFPKIPHSRDKTPPEYFSPLRVAFYKQIAQQKVLLSWDVTQLTSPELFLSPSDPTVVLSSRKESALLAQSLSAVARRLVSLPERVYEGLAAVIGTRRLLSPSLVRSLFRGAQAPASELSLDHLLVLMAFVAGDLDVPSLKELTGVFIVPTLSPLRVAFGQKLLVLSAEDLKDLELSAAVFPSVLHPRVLDIPFFSKVEVQASLHWSPVRLNELLSLVQLLPATTKPEGEEVPLLITQPEVLKWFAKLWKWVSKSQIFPSESQQLLPVFLGTQAGLLPLRFAIATLLPPDPLTSPALIHLLHKLGLPFLMGDVCTASSDWWREYAKDRLGAASVPRSFSPLDLLEAIKSAKKLKLTLNWNLLTAEERRQLLTLLCTVSDHAFRAEDLRSLPLYETSDGDFLSLERLRGRDLYLQPGDISWHLFPETMGNVIFFRELRAASPLYTALGIIPLTDQELLERHLLPTLHLRHPREQLEIVRRLFSSVGVPEAEKLLRERRFLYQMVPEASAYVERFPPQVFTMILRYLGDKVTLLSPAHIVRSSAKLLSISKPFPPPAYCTAEWDSIFEQLHVPNDDILHKERSVFVKLCADLSQRLRSLPNSQRLVRIARELLSHPTLPEPISDEALDWRCLPTRNPPLVGLPLIESIAPLASLRELGDASLAESCWTVLRICDSLPLRFQPLVRQQVTPVVVARHILEVKKIYSASAEHLSPALVTTLVSSIDVSLVTLSLMMESSSKSSSSSAREITEALSLLRGGNGRNLNVGLVWLESARKFLPANMFAFDLHEDIYPYLYRVPPTLLNAKTLLVSLGCAETANSTSVYRDILAKMAERSKVFAEDGVTVEIRPLSLPEQELFSHILRALVRFLRTEEGNESDGEDSENSLPPIEGLHLPDIRWRMLPAKHLVYVDSTEIQLDRIPEGIFSYVNPILKSRETCRRLGVKMLKDRVSLFFTPDGQPSETDPLTQRGRAWQLMIQSSTFADALTRLIVRYQSPEWRLNTRNRTDLRERLQQIRLFRVRVFARLFARYVLQPENREIASNVPHGSMQYALVIESRDIYIFSAETSAMTNAMAEILTGFITTQAITSLMKLLESSEISQLHTLLDLEGVPPMEITDLTPDGALVRREGDLVEDADRTLLSEDLTDADLQLSLNELVAWTQQENTIENRHYFYGRVVGVAPNSESLPPLLRQYVIRISTRGDVRSMSVVFLAKINTVPRPAVSPLQRIADVQNALAAAQQMDEPSRKQVLRRVVHKNATEQSDMPPEIVQQIVASVAAQLPQEEALEAIGLWQNEARRDATFAQMLVPRADVHMARNYAIQALHDLQTAKYLFDHVNEVVAYDKCCFLAQQAVEKMLRATAEMHGITGEFLKHHRLDLICETLQHRLQDRWPARECTPSRALANHYLQSRYPDLSNAIPHQIYTVITARAALDEAMRIVNVLRERFLSELIL